SGDWSSDVCSSDLEAGLAAQVLDAHLLQGVFARGRRHIAQPAIADLQDLRQHLVDHAASSTGLPPASRRLSWKSRIAPAAATLSDSTPSAIGIVTGSRSLRRRPSTSPPRARSSARSSSAWPKGTPPA